MPDSVEPQFNSISSSYEEETTPKIFKRILNNSLKMQFKDLKFENQKIKLHFPKHKC